MKYFNSTSGMTLIELTLGMALAGITLYVVGSMVSYAVTVDVKIRREMDAMTIQADVANSVRNPSVCSCNLDASQNTSLASVLKLDSTLLGTAQTIHIGEWRSTCNFTSTSNFVVKEGVNAGIMGSAMIPSDVSITGIRRNGDSGEYYGNVEVTFPFSDEMPTSKVSVPVVFAIDPTKGTANARPTLRCTYREEAATGSSTIYLKDCPPNFVMIGNPSEKGSYCVEKDLRPATTTQNANGICVAATPVGYPIGKLCTTQLLYLACVNNPGGINNIGTTNEFVWGTQAGSNNGETFGGSGCRSGDLASSLPYRCCIY